MWRVWRKRELCLGLWLRHLKERDRLEDLGVGGRIILKSLKETGWDHV
jgi:hypothetical protein